MNSPGQQAARRATRVKGEAEVVMQRQQPHNPGLSRCPGPPPAALYPAFDTSMLCSCGEHPGRPNATLVLRGRLSAEALALKDGMGAVQVRRN